MRILSSIYYLESVPLANLINKSLLSVRVIYPAFYASDRSVSTCFKRIANSSASFCAAAASSSAFLLAAASSSINYWSAYACKTASKFINGSIYSTVTTNFISVVIFLPSFFSLIPKNSA